MRKFFAFALSLLFMTSIIACQPGIVPVTNPTPQLVPTQTTNPIQPLEIISSATILGTTQNNLSGNHLVEGSIDLANATTLDIPLSGEPRWLVSVPYNDGAVFAAVLDDGTVQAFLIAAETYQSFEITPTQLPAGSPPLLAATDTGVYFITPPADASPLTNPMLLENQLVYIANNGDLVLDNAGSQTRLAIDVLPDARILIDEQQRLLILTQPSTRYDHGILGDKLEAIGIILIETQPELRVLINIPIQVPDVIESLSPTWADMNQDGQREIIVTLSNNQGGSRMVVFAEDGTLLAESSAIGTGHRWRHQIAVAPFASDAAPLLVVIRTPHIGGVVEFFQLHNGALQSAAEIKGFSTHSIGSRNLDSALVGDFNNDGINEVLAPNQAHTQLGVISLDGNVTLLPLDSKLISNLSAVVINGKIIIGADTSENLRVWLP
ncbi:MAG: hypothetical protein JEZ00_21160 [Anaerolineaceae bacterium]|nr:hypothetical protein [Anaerolineaceae bacterium]